MSKIKHSNQLFLGKQELDRSWKFSVDEGYKRLLLQQTYEFGIVKAQDDPNFNSFKVEAGTNASTIKIAQDSFAINSEGNVIFKRAEDNIAIPNNSTWYAVRIEHVYTTLEEGTVNIDASGNMTGTGTKFTEILRGQPNFPARVKFNASGAGNTGEYDVVEVIDNTNAVLSGIFAAENNLQYAVYGTFTPGHTPLVGEAYPFQYDSCDLDLFATNDPSGVTVEQTNVTAGQEFLIAMVRSVSGVVEVRDLRKNIWRSKADYEMSNVYTDANPLIGVESIKYDHEQGTKEKNQIQIGWGFRSSNFTVDSSLRKITINAGEGGKFKSTADFTTGDFDGWLVYEREGGWQKILTSTKTASDINLFLDTLIVEDYSSPEVGGEELIVVPDAEAIELKFGPDEAITSIEQLRKTVEYPIGAAVAREWLLVPVDAGSTYKYNVQYRVRRANAYSQWRQLPKDLNVGYYDESSFDANGVLNASVNDRNRVTYGNTVALDYGTITFTANPSNYQNFQGQVTSGDVFGTTTITISNGSPVQVLTAGTSKSVQYVQGTVVLSTNHIFDLDSSAGVDGNEFTVIFNISVTPGGYGIRFTTGYVNSGNVGTILHYFTPSDLDWMKMPRKQIAFHCRKISGSWKIYSAELPTSRLGDIAMFGQEVDLTTGVNFTANGLGISDEYNGWALCNGQNGTVDLRGRFIAGYNVNDTNYQINDTGGADRVKLTASQSAMPEHTHSLSGATGTISGNTGGAGGHSHISRGTTRYDDGSGSGSTLGPNYGPPGQGGDQWTLTNSVGNHTHTLSGSVSLSGSTGSASDAVATDFHENRPAFTVLGFVQRIPFSAPYGGPGGSVSYPNPTF